jgi:hypothetical protein
MVLNDLPEPDQTNDASQTRAVLIKLIQLVTRDIARSLQREQDSAQRKANPPGDQAMSIEAEADERPTASTKLQDSVQAPTGISFPHA